MGDIIVIRKYEETPENYVRVDVTSHNNQWKHYVSPFYLGPVFTADGNESLNMENAWQYSKVYDDMVDENNNPNELYYKWRELGFNTQRANRHPHKGKPLYSLYKDEHLGYIDARKKLYIPLYMQGVLNRPDGLNLLINKYNEGYNIALADFDAYQHKKLGMTYDDVINNPNKIMGHGFVLAMMVENLEYMKKTYLV